MPRGAAHGEEQPIVPVSRQRYTPHVIPPPTAQSHSHVPRAQRSNGTIYEFALVPGGDAQQQPNASASLAVVADPLWIHAGFSTLALLETRWLHQAPAWYTLVTRACNKVGLCSVVKASDQLLVITGEAPTSMRAPQLGARAPSGELFLSVASEMRVEWDGFEDQAAEPLINSVGATAEAAGIRAAAALQFYFRAAAQQHRAQEWLSGSPQTAKAKRVREALPSATKAFEGRITRSTTHCKREKAPNAVAAPAKPRQP